jgi:hypothetical protein
MAVTLRCRAVRRALRRPAKKHCREDLGSMGRVRRGQHGALIVELVVSDRVR